CHSVLHRMNGPCDLKDARCPFIDVFRNGKTVQVTHRHFTSRGNEITVEITASPLRDADGSITGMLEILRDISVVRRLEVENKQSIEFLTSVLEGIGEGVVVMDRDYRILTANRGYLAQVGMVWSDVIGRHCYEVSHHFTAPCMDSGHDCPVRTVFATGQPACALHIHFDQRNERIYVECRAYPVRDDSGTVVRAIETINDVTERVRLEHKLRESEEKYRDLYDNAPDGYYSVAGNGLIVEVNRTFLEMLGYAREEVVGTMYLDELLTDESASVCRVKFPELKKKGRIANLEMTMRKKDGSLLPVMLSATAVISASAGTFVMSRTMIRDISERKKAEEEKRKLQERLFQSQKLEALGTLAGSIAHDFNNLLASILGYASLAKADLPAGDPVAHHVDIIEAASLRASELTQQLLAFARGGKYDPRPNDVNAIVREAVALLGHTADRNVAVELHLSDDLKSALCDAGQIQQAILNICINARDAMQKGGTLSIDTQNVTLTAGDVQFLVDVPPGDYVRVSVADTGPGMDRETREHIFEPFFTTKKKGTGLGLAIAYGIVRKHNGFIHVSSAPGQGSLFQVNLVACTEEQPCAKQRQIISLRRGSETILVVDDEPMITDLASDILRRYGYAVLAANSGPEAVELYRRNAATIGAVVLDMVMPGMDGSEVFSQLCAVDPRVKVIASSGYDHDHDTEDILSRGALGFVQKPYRITELVKLVGDVLEEK
ncbi:MAG TPA: PAS domain S-box protein, partial [Nitrospirota bacterium]